MYGFSHTIVFLTLPSLPPPHWAVVDHQFLVTAGPTGGGAAYLSLMPCAVDRTTHPERTLPGHIRGQCTLTQTDANMPFPEFCCQTNYNSPENFMLMFVVRFYCVVSALAALSKQARSRRMLAVRQCNCMTPSHTATDGNSRNTLSTRYYCSRANFRAFLLSFGLLIVTGVAKERKRTRPRPQKHVSAY